MFWGSCYPSPHPPAVVGGAQVEFSVAPVVWARLRLPANSAGVVTFRLWVDRAPPFVKGWGWPWGG